jgi:hypothetical protein
MKLEIGMYVRTKRDGIAKIISLSIDEEEECCFIELSKRRTGIKEHNITKASFNIIDLIEIGDYVNGKQVIKVSTDYIFDYSEEIIIIYFSEEDYIYSSYDIKSIVTKEQFESVQYKVVE